MSTIRKYDPRTVELESTPRAASDAETWSLRFYVDEGAGQYQGIWQADPGVHGDLPGHETVVILEGRATVSGVDGSSVDVSAGDLVIVDFGEVATWTVHERLRKVFVINARS